MRSLRPPYLWIAGSTLLLTASVAHAEVLDAREEVDAKEHPREPVQESADQSHARELFLTGTELAEKALWNSALAAYQESHRLYPNAATLYNVGYCYAKLEDFTSALRVTLESLDDSRFPPNRRLTAERRRMAEAQQKALRDRVALVTLRGAPVRRATVDSLPLPLIEATNQDSPSDPIAIIQPGTVSLTLTTAEGDRTYRLELAPGEQRTLLVEAPPSMPSAPRVPTESPLRTQLPVTDPAPVREETNWWRGSGIGALTVGGVGFGVAAVSAIVAVRTDHRLSARCSAELLCSAAESDSLDRYQRAVRWTNVGLMTGLVGTATGLGLLWLAPTSTPRQSATIGLSLSGVYFQGAY